MLRDLTSGSTATALRETADASRTAQPHSAPASGRRSLLLFALVVITIPRSSNQGNAPQSQTVRHDADGAERHGCAGDDRAQHQAGDREKHTRRDRDADDVVYE